jgi:S1-C subfamily serine protease
MQLTTDTKPAARRLFALALMVLSTCLSAADALEPDPFAHGWQAFEAGDYAQALSIWQKLAEQGDNNARINLGIMYDHGKGVDPDPHQAATWYQIAGAGGHAAAQFNLGLMYTEGRGVEQSPVKAAYWLLQAAEQGLADAQYRLATHLHTTQGIPRNSEVVQHWLSMAAAQGHSDAVAMLAGVAHGSVRVESPDRQTGFSAGTAWPITSGYVVTNNHVVADVDEVGLIDVAGREVRASVVLRDETHDLALLGVNDFENLPPALPLAEAPTRLGSSVFTIGYPRIDIMGRTPKLTDGIISAINGFRDDPGSYQISVPIQPGNSGGPLLNMAGEVVGVVASMLGVADGSAEPQVFANINYAIKVDVLRRMLPLLPRQDAVLEELPGVRANLSDLAARIQGSVLIVMVSD